MPRGVWDRKKAKWKKMTQEESQLAFEIELVSWVCDNAPWKDEYAPVHFESCCMTGNYWDALQILKKLSCDGIDDEAGK